MSELLLISVPGVTRTPEHALLRVVVVPRLSGTGTTLADYGMQHWPVALAQAGTMRVQLRTANGQDLPPIDVAVQHDAEPEVWDAFFGAIHVIPFAGTPTYADTSVTPTGDHAQQVDGAYAVAVASVGDPEKVEQQLDALRFADPPPAPDPKAPLPAIIDPDFHRVVSLMRQHPVVLRALGLILDLHVPKRDLDRCGVDGEISVGWPRPPVPVEVITSPATRFVVRRGRFFAAPATTTVVDEVTGGTLDAPVDAVVDGMVDLARTSQGDPTASVAPGARQPDWAVHTFDVDAAVARLTDARAAVARSRVPAAEPTAAPASAAAIPAPAVMPALRTVGLQLVHRPREAWFAGRHARAVANAANAANNADAGGAASMVLTADDLVLGYRLDVSFTGSDWHSMMRRWARYTVNDLPIAGGGHSEEGHIPAAAGVKGTDETVYSDGVVVRWAGHRLSLPRPRLDGPASRAEVVHAGPYRFEWTHEIDPAEPSGMPELRFGESYQMRLRVVDIAGGGLECDQVAGSTSASPDTVYARHEPVLPPQMPPPAELLGVVPGTDGRRRAEVDPDVLGPGGSLTRLVIRSDPAAEDAGPVVQADVAAAYPANDRRMLLPPAATFTLAEWEGMLGGNRSTNTPVHVAVDDLAAWRLARRALAVPRASAEPQGGRHYTWVPDPGADSVSVTVLPLATRLGTTQPAVRDWNTASWPDHEPKHLHIVPADPGPSRQPTCNWTSAVTAEVVLPAACRAVLEVSSAIRSTYFAHFAAAKLADSTAPLDAMLMGRHPVTTPALRIEVVHAVRAPLGKPAGNVEADRQPGDLSATLRDPASPLLGIDRDSTFQIDVVASWQEWTDAAVPTPVTQSVGSFPVDLDAPRLPPIVHRFGDTRHRLITYRLAARSRFRDFFAATDPESAFVRESELAPIHVPSTVRPTEPVLLAVSPATRTVSDVSIGFSPAHPSDPDDVDGDGIPDSEDDHIDLIGIDVSPSLVFLPTIHREGGILRVELAAPWFTTGEGEQLGVVVSPGPDFSTLQREQGADGEIAGHDTAHSSLVTRVYRDPILSTPAPVQPTAASMTRTGGSPLVVLDTESGVPICVVPFDVVRVDGRWFADIGFGDLADSSIRPFVQLKLVRFQRHSLHRLTTSPVVTTDLVAVLPSRDLGVDLSDQGHVVTLSGTGGGGPVELRMESAPVDTPLEGLTALDPAGAGWTSMWRVDGQLNTPFAAVVMRDDGRLHRIVVRELDQIPPRTDPPITGVLEQANARLTQFVGVIHL